MTYDKEAMRRKVLAHWEHVFAQETPEQPAAASLGHEALDDALAWLCKGTHAAVDFGCGNGRVLCACGMRGVEELTGIDLSAQGIAQARRLAALSGLSATLLCGGVEALEAMAGASCDAAICFNILDNLPPEEAHRALAALHRVLRPGGKLLIKLNPYLTARQIEEWHVRVLDGELLDDGLLLWNLPTEKWGALLSPYFEAAFWSEVYYPQFDQVNRLYQGIRAVGFP